MTYLWGNKLNLFLGFLDSHQYYPFNQSLRRLLGYLRGLLRGKIKKCKKFGQHVHCLEEFSGRECLQIVFVIFNFFHQFHRMTVNMTCSVEREKRQQTRPVLLLYVIVRFLFHTEIVCSLQNQTLVGRWKIVLNV